MFPKCLDPRTKSSFEIVHTDVWGPSRSASILGFRYFVTFVDDYSQCTWLFLMKTRAELFSVFQKFHTKIRTQFNTSIRILRSDNAKTYFSMSFFSFMSSHEIFTNHLVLTLLNRMEWLSVRTVIWLRQLALYSFIIRFLYVFGGMLS